MGMLTDKQIEATQGLLASWRCAPTTDGMIYDLAWMLQFRNEQAPALDAGLVERMTAEGRVTIRRGEMDSHEHHVTVYLDGTAVCCNLAIYHAAIYRIGLIATLKQEGK